MASLSNERKLQDELTQMLVPVYPEMAVKIGVSKRWNRPCITVQWQAFADLLPEERFERITRVIPEDFREKRLQGFVWLELAHGESVDEFLKLPRSEDLADREREIYRGLVRTAFFEVLRKRLGTSPEKRCAKDFTRSESILAHQLSDAVTAIDVKLLFIRHGIYCDCQILGSGEPALREFYAGAA